MDRAAPGGPVCPGPSRHPYPSGNQRLIFEWFMASGMADVDSPMVDPLWRASWDFEWEAEVADRARQRI